MTYCNCCNSSIEQERLSILPQTKVCSNCARGGACQPRKVRGVMVYPHKTGSEIQVLAADTYDSNKKYFVANGARSAVKNFSKHVCA